MFLPFCIVGLLMAIFEVIDGREALGVYAMVGSFVLGGGLLLCVMVDYDEEVFWRLNVYPTIIGFLVTFGNLFLACTNIPGIEFDEARLDFQLCCYLSAFNCLISYAASREAISDCILAHTGLSKEQLEEMRQDLIEIFDEEYEKRRVITADFTAEKMSAKGYRKQSDGEWIKDEKSKFKHRYHCTACDFYLIGAPTKHCPNCGARMKGDRKEDEGK